MQTNAIKNHGSQFQDVDDGIFEEVINIYLRILDRQQDEIYNVRMMHHEVWRDVHQVTGISETRAGSRVERYTKILPVGARSDVDYKLCVEDVEVETEKNEKFYLETCFFKAYCKVNITTDGKQILKENKLLSKLFHGSFCECPGSEKSLVLPGKFKVNVVQHCQFEMKEAEKTTLKTSPAVSGEGALNPYDIVPCLKLRSWPTFLRKRVLEMYDFKSSDGHLLPIFIVPTGNPLSRERDLEWRLSFAVLEIEIFRQLKSQQRRLYGLAKYVFKVFFEDVGLIQSYHLKILFLRKLEDDDLSQVNPLSFLELFFHYVFHAVEGQYIPHLFIEDCNIYPSHYHSETKVEQFRLKIADDFFKHEVRTKIKEIISHDTKVKELDWNCWLRKSKEVLEKHEKAGMSEVWIAGYLTRLLSVITYCLIKSQRQGNLKNAIFSLVTLLETNCHDKYIKRVVPHIKCMLKDVYDTSTPSIRGPETSKSCDQVSLIIHRAFFCYEKGDIDGALDYISEAEDTIISEDTFGVTVTKFHKGLDPPLDYVIDFCEKQLNSNRFYLYPTLIHLHMIIQICLRDTLSSLEQEEKKNITSNNAALQRYAPHSKVCVTCEDEFDCTTDMKLHHLNILLQKLVKETERASLKEPYTGKLSYSHASYLLLLGYKKQLSNSPYKGMSEILPEISYNSTLYDRKDRITNFDLR